MNAGMMRAVVDGRGAVTRRSFLRAGAGLAASGATGLWHALALAQEDAARRAGKRLILLWMDGGPSQYETFAPKLGSPRQGPTQAISTSVPGVAIAEHWPRMATRMHELAVLGSMTGGPTDHDRAIQYVRTGYERNPSIAYPTFGSVVAWQREDAVAELPAFVRIGKARADFPSRNPDAGVLGARFNPLLAREPGQLPPDVARQVPEEVLRRRLAFAGRLADVAGQDSALAQRDRAFRDVQSRAARMSLGREIEAFDLERESPSTREAYGPTPFGQGCLLARRLVERGVSFIEVMSAEGSEGWDTHKGEAFKSNARLSEMVDVGMAALIQDLKVRGLLEDTLVVWMGEFGRTPGFNDDGGGRDHYSQAWIAAVAGGGVQGGRFLGATDADGIEVTDRPITVPDLMVTFCHVLGLDPRAEYVTHDARPVKIAEQGKVIHELFA